MNRTPSFGTAFLASAALPLGAGAAVGLLDAGVAAAGGARASFGFFGLSASLGAALALAAVGPVLVAAAFARRGATTLTMAAVGTVAAPFAFAAARVLYKRLPWDAGDAVLAAAALAGFVALFIVARRVFVPRLEPHAPALARRLAFAAVPLLLVAMPAFLRAIPAARGELEARGRTEISAPPATPASSAAAPSAAPRPGLLLLSIDTMRADRLGCAGDPDLRTPHLDRLARTATQFSNCRTISPWTLPSLATLLTGTYPGEHRMLEELTALADSVPSLPETLRREGWRTGAFVSNPWLATGSLARGFDPFDVAERIESFATLSPTHLYRALSKALLRGASLDAGRAISGRGLAWISRAEADGAPWFAWLHYFDPHLPNWPAAPLDRLGGPPPRRVGASITVEEIRGGDLDEDARREIERLYDAEVVVTDLAVARVLRALASTGRLDELVVIVTGDHGEEFWEHRGYGHGHSMFDEVLRVPLFARGPGLPAGRVDPRPARLLDVAPTAVAAVGAPAPTSPRGFSGRDLFADAFAPDTTYGEATLYGPEQKFLLADDSKLILIPEAAPGDSIRLLFNLDADPAELADLASSPLDSSTSSPSTSLADSLLARLVAWKKRVGSDRTTTSGSIPEGLDPAVRDQLEALGYIQR